jgi:4-hydroxymandelate oxidase
VRLPFGLDELEARARECLSPSAHGYFADAAYADAAGLATTAAANERAWSRFLLRPRVLVDVSRVSTATSLLGTPVALPILPAPCAYNGIAHPDAEAAVARAAAAVGTIHVVSSASTLPLEEIARARGAPQWFQLYTDPDRGVTDARVASAEALGFRALVFTVDAPVGAPRYHGYPELGFGPVASAASLDPGLDWREIDRIAARASLPVVLKGILHPADAALAAQHGVAAVIVSNHGGRQLDGAIPTALALPEIVAAVSGRIEVLVDGGIRSARDVLRALALGARAVLIGRPYLWALAIAGEEGVRELFQRLGEELRNALMLTGQVDASRVDPDIVVRD